MKPRNLLFVLAILVLSTGTSDARNRRSMGESNYVSNGKFGLGLELGAPFGINGKYFLDDNHALNFGVGEIYDGYYDRDLDRDGIHLYLDYMWHPFVLGRPEPFQVPFFVGIGGRIWDFNDRSRFNDDGFAIGARCPIGIALDFNKVPLDIWFQFTFVADVFANDYRGDRFGLHIEGSLGIRYWFD